MGYGAVGGAALLRSTNFLDGKLGSHYRDGAVLSPVKTQAISVPLTCSCLMSILSHYAMRLSLLAPALLVLATPVLVTAQDSSCDVFVRHGMVQHFREISGASDQAMMRQAFASALQQLNQQGTSGGATVGFGGFSFGGNYSRQELEAINKFLSSSSESASASQRNAETVRAYISPEAYAAAIQCWQLQERRSLRINLNWDETEFDEFTLSLAYVPVGQPNASTELRGVDIPQGHGITCGGDLMQNRRITPVAKALTCRRNVSGQTVLSATGVPVRARSALISVQTGVGNIPVTMPEIPAGPSWADPTPVGTIIDWFMPRGASIPAGYVLCDGNPINVPGSPLNGTNAPNLIDRFLMGVAPANVGSTGGRNDIPRDGGHSHGGMTGGISYARGEANWQTVRGYEAEYSHRHPISEDGFHTHGGDNRPAYFGVVKLLKVLATAPIPQPQTNR